MELCRLSGLVVIKDLQELDLGELTVGISRRFEKTRKKRLEKIKEAIADLSAKETKNIFDEKDKQGELDRLEEIKKTVRDYADREEFIGQAGDLVQELEEHPEAHDEIVEKYLRLLSSVIRIETRLDEEPMENGKYEAREVGVSTSKSRSRDDNSDLDIFMKTLQRHRGQLLQNVPKSLLEVIDAYIESWDHLSKYHRRNIENLELKKNGMRKGTSLQMMMQILKETNNPLYYDRVRPISILYWKWQIPDIGECEDRILKDYKATQRVYKEKIKGKFRKSNLNIQYRLLKHLEARGIPVHRDDFKLICGHEILVEYDKMWKIMVEESGIEDLLFIPTA